MRERKVQARYYSLESSVLDTIVYLPSPLLPSMCSMKFVSPGKPQMYNNPNTKKGRQARLIILVLPLM